MALCTPFNDTRTTKTLAPYYSVLQVSAESCTFAQLQRKTAKKIAQALGKRSITVHRIFTMIYCYENT